MLLFDRSGTELRGESINLSQHFSIPYLHLTHKLLEQSFPKVWSIDQLFQRDMENIDTCLLPWMYGIRLSGEGGSKNFRLLIILRQKSQGNQKEVNGKLTSIIISLTMDQIGVKKNIEHSSREKAKGHNIVWTCKLFGKLSITMIF